MIIIGVAGWTGKGSAGAGKDQFVDFCLDWCKTNSISSMKCNLADQLKIELSKTFRIPKHYLYDRKLKESGVLESSALDYMADKNCPNTYRGLMQTYGQEMRKKNPNYWVERLKQHVSDIGFGGLLFVPDIRMDNEIEMCDLVLRVDRPLYNDISIDTHETERKIPRTKIDTFIYNNGDLSDLKNTSVKFMESYRNYNYK